MTDHNKKFYFSRLIYNIEINISQQIISTQDSQGKVCWQKSIDKNFSLSIKNNNNNNKQQLSNGFGPSLLPTD